MSPSHPPKIALVTGAGSGIGRVTALGLLDDGFTVVLAGRRAEPLNALAADAADRGQRALAVPADVTDPASVQALFDTIETTFGRLDVLFNNAGVMPHQDVSLLDADLDLWRTITGINLHGTALCTKYAVPHLTAAGGGAIVNMSSFLVDMGCTVPQDAYAASKGAISALTRSMAAQFGARGIRCNALAPGPVLTPHVEHFFPDPEARAERLARIPLGRFGRPDDVAGLACFLASDDAAWLTGQIVVLDGGISCFYL